MIRKYIEQSLITASQWLLSRRLRLIVGTVLSYVIFFTLLRLLFYFQFSGIENTHPTPVLLEVLKVFYIGLKFDIRLAILICLPLMVLSVTPANLFRYGLLKTMSEIILAIFSVVLVLFYAFDFGHYNYLGLRINSGVLRFLGDREPVAMLWQSYPIISIVIGVVACCAILIYVNNRLHHFFTTRTPKLISIPSVVIGSFVTLIVLILGLLGRYSDINFHNPVPLRWDTIHSTQNSALAATGINPVVYFFSTFQYKQQDYDLNAAKHYYDVVADYLSVTKKSSTTLSLDRFSGIQPNKLVFKKMPNVVFIMLESLGASRMSAYGLPIESTPTLDNIANNGLFFKNFYVPVLGTSKTVWASITGIPDTTTHDTATRNPHISHQRMIINQFVEHEKLYAIGGNASWANMSALIEKSIDGVTLYEESYWQSPVTDVWGISDLALFQEIDKILSEKHQENKKPFFAIIQTAGNHRPFTIPKQRSNFKVKRMDAELLSGYGFRSNAQFNAVRFLDHAIGEFLRLAKRNGYFDNTIFVMYGDHNNRITTIPHMALFYKKLNLDELHVPFIIYAPKLIPQKTIKEAVSLVDLMPTVAGLLGIQYKNTTFGRDVFNPVRKRDRYVFTSTSNRADPIIGMVSDRYMLRKYAQRSKAKLHDLRAGDPERDISADKPKLFDYLKKLTQGIYETSRYQMYNNRDD